MRKEDKPMMPADISARIDKLIADLQGMTDEKYAEYLQETNSGKYYQRLLRELTEQNAD